jgi:hypothetical protein
LRGLKVTLERTRAEANEELVQTLEGWEEESARHRKRENKNQIRDLEKGWRRQSGRRKGKRVE